MKMRRRIVAVTKKYLGVALKMRARMTIAGLFLLAVAATLLNIQQSPLAFAAGGEDNNVLHVRKESTNGHI
jgi:hypothetical protein